MAGGLSILMPVFNERSTVEAAIDDALTAELPVASRELVVVDDGSTDGTRELLRSTRVARRASRSSSTSGTSARAPPCAPRSSTRRRSSPRSSTPTSSTAPPTSRDVLEPLVSGEAHVVFGTRAWTSQSSFSFWYVMGNKSVTMATNVLYNCWISDVMTCHKAMRTELFRSLPLRERGFAIEPEIAARVLRAGERIHEVPISLHGARSREAGKKLTSTRRAPRPANARPLPRDVSARGTDRLGRRPLALRRRRSYVGPRLALVVALRPRTTASGRDEIMTVEDFVRRGPARDPRRAYIPNNHELFSLLGWAHELVRRRVRGRLLRLPSVAAVRRRRRARDRVAARPARRARPACSSSSSRRCRRCCSTSRGRRAATGSRSSR